MMKKGLLRLALPVCLLLGLLAAAPAARAEGTRDLAENGGGRPYTERYDAAVLGQQRLSVMHVYLMKGETVCFGTSVSDARLYNTVNGKNKDWLFSNDAMGTSYTDAQLAYVNTADIFLAPGNYANVSDAIAAGKTPGKAGTVLIDLPSQAGRTTPGCIYDSRQEAGGADLTGAGSGYKVSSVNTIASSAAGYIEGVKTNANTYTAPEDGIYTAAFFSSSHTGDTPVARDVTDTAPFSETQKGGCIASWDISVYSGGTRQPGRVFADKLCLNTGGADISSSVYAVTDDGYQYKADLNGMNPSDLMLFADNRGLLKVDETGSSSLMHSVRSDNDALSDLSEHGVELSASAYDSTLDREFALFFEKPSDEALRALKIAAPQAITASGISNFKFTGAGGAAQGYAGCGGTFSFTAEDVHAGSYQIVLSFSTGDAVLLSNALVPGTNSIAWDGRDARGSVVPAGTTCSAALTLKSGEIHFPLLDVEQNTGGIKITRLNGTAPDAVVYYNNSASGAGNAAYPWTAANWTVGDGADHSVTGVDSSAAAALSCGGDKTALDVWACGSSAAAGACSFSLTDTSFTATVNWNNDAGMPANGNPQSVSVTLRYSSGAPVTSDAEGKAITNPVTLNTSAASYTWHGLDASKTYIAAEAPAAGYTETVSAAAGNAADGYACTITNTYTPASLTLACVWNMNGSGEAHPDSAVFSVYTDANRQQKLGDYTLTDAGGWTETIPVDPTLTYYVYETAPDGYTVIGEGMADGSGSAGFTSVVTNSYNGGGKMSVEAFVAWHDSGFEADRPDSVLVTLCKDGIPVTTDAAGSPVTNPAILSASNGWYYIWPACWTKTRQRTVIPSQKPTQTATRWAAMPSRKKRSA